MISRILQLLSSSIFARESRQPKFLQLSLVTILFIFGVYYWLFLLNYGVISHQAYDWDLFFSYDSVMENAVHQLKIPYHASYEFFHTNRFFGIPEVNLLPDIFLFSFLSMREYHLVRILLAFTVGFIGCVLLKKHFDLSLFAFAILFVLFNFNGFIISHALVGHFWVLGYYLLPFLIFNVITLMEGSNHCFVRNVSFLLFIMMLGGAIHIYVISLMFLVLIFIFNIRFFPVITQAIGWSLLLSLVRFVPAAVALWDLKHSFISGFSDLRMLMISFCVALPHDYFQWTGPYWNEYNFFIGILGFVFIIYFGVVAQFLHKKAYVFPALAGALCVMIILSFRNYYSWIANLPIPLVDVERLPSRFIMIPLVVLVIAAAVRFQDTLDKISNSKLTFIFLLAFVYGAHQVFLQASGWNLNFLQRDVHFYNTVLIKPEVVSFSRDSFYINAVNISLWLSLIFLGIWSKIFLFKNKLKRNILWN